MLSNKILVVLYKTLIVLSFFLINIIVLNATKEKYEKINYDVVYFASLFFCLTMFFCGKFLKFSHFKSYIIGSFAFLIVVLIYLVF